MHTFAIEGKYRIAFGLLWISLQGDEDQVRSDAIKKARELDADWWYGLEIDGVMQWAGYLTDSGVNSDSIEQGTFISAVAAVCYAAVPDIQGKSLISKNSVVAGKIGDGYGLVIIRDGVPVTGFEIWSTDPKNIANLIKQYITGLSVTGTVDTEVYCDTDDIVLDNPCNPIGLKKIVARWRSFAALKPVNKFSKKHFIALTAFIVMFAIIYYAWNTWEASKQRELAEMQKNAADKYGLSVINNETIKPRYNSSDVWNAVLVHLQQQETEIAGWRLIKGECVIEELKCKLFWKVSDTAKKPITFESFLASRYPGKADIPKNLNITSTNSLDETVVLQVKSKIFPANWDKLIPVGKLSTIKLGSAFQNLTQQGAVWQFTEPVTLLPASPAASGLDRGTWTMNGPGWIFKEMTNLPFWVYIDKINYDIVQDEVSFSAWGYYLAASEKL